MENEQEIIEREQVSTVEAQNVEMKQSMAVNVLANDVNMNQSTAAIVKADKVNMKDSFALILNADEVEGDTKALLSPTSALIAGGAILLAVLLWRRR